MDEIMAGITANLRVNFRTPFHLVDRSPWPFLTGFLALQLPIALLIYINSGKTTTLFYSFLVLLYITKRW